LLVNILGRETEIEIPFNCIKAIFRNKKWRFFIYLPKIRFPFH
jgi:hypothetical protein